MERVGKLQVTVGKAAPGQVAITRAGSNLEGCQCGLAIGNDAADLALLVNHSQLGLGLRKRMPFILLYVPEIQSIICPGQPPDSVIDGPSGSACGDPLKELPWRCNSAEMRVYDRRRTLYQAK
jgi:hypothetical protein